MLGLAMGSTMIHTILHAENVKLSGIYSNGKGKKVVPITPFWLLPVLDILRRPSLLPLKLSWYFRQPQFSATIFYVL
jgi:hypothetical protein